MTKFCVVLPWCTPREFRALSYGDYLRLKPTVEAIVKGR